MGGVTANRGQKFGVGVRVGGGSVRGVGGGRGGEGHAVGGLVLDAGSVARIGSEYVAVLPFDVLMDGGSAGEAFEDVVAHGNVGCYVESTGDNFFFQGTFSTLSGWRLRLIKVNAVGDEDVVCRVSLSFSSIFRDRHGEAPEIVGPFRWLFC